MHHPFHIHGAGGSSSSAATAHESEPRGKTPSWCGPTRPSTFSSTSPTRPVDAHCHIAEHNQWNDFSFPVANRRHTPISEGNHRQKDNT